MSGQMHPQGWNVSGRAGLKRSERAGLHVTVAGLAGSAAHPDHSDGQTSAAVRQRGVRRYLHIQHAKPQSFLYASKKRHPQAKRTEIAAVGRASGQAAAVVWTETRREARAGAGVPAG